MKKTFYFVLLFSVLSCSKKPTELIGIWEVKTSYHKATYSIEEHENRIVGRVKYYDDNTYIYKESGTHKDIFLHKLKRKDSIYIDAISGATMTNKELVIQRKHEDTLEVTKYIHNKPLKEFWIKKRN